MNEEELKKRIIRVTVIVVISSILLCVSVFCTSKYIFKEAHKADDIQMEVEVKEYKSRIIKQLDKSAQILTTLSKAYEVSNILNSPDILKRSLEEANKENAFLTLAYIPIEGEGFLNVNNKETIENYTLDDCGEMAKDAIRKSFQGEIGISKMFDSEYHRTKMFIYSVPVYQNGEITGALAAGDTLEIFKDIVNGNTVMGGNGYVHIINVKGEFLLRSENTLVKDDISSIFDGPYMSEKTKKDARRALENGESYHGSFEYENNKCHFYMESIGFNGWYIFCANRMWSSAMSSGRLFLVIISGFVGILFVMLILLYAGYYKFRQSAGNLIRLAYYDQVTGAKNTSGFDEEFHKFLRKNQHYSVAALNIHNFKGVNDLFGKNSGNDVLCFLKQTIEKDLKEGEFFCRDSADLFYVLLLDYDEKIITERTRNIIQLVSSASASFGEYSYEISIYSGIAIDGDREKALVALQSIQNSHYTDIAFYTQALYEKIRSRIEIESYMHLALKNREYKLFLQPKNNLKTGQIMGAEALVRWKKADGTYRYPNEFIPLFTANGFCRDLDMYMVERVCEQIRSWIDAGIEPIPISVNQSKLLFTEMDYPSRLEQTVKHYGIPSSLITLEILEDIATDDLAHLNVQIELLHEKGFKVSMDDFGSGYSSLTMLYQLKIDELKLDRGFLKNVSEDNQKRRQIILHQIIQLANKLGISTVAEGIETTRDRDNMLSLSCDCGQGYLYDKPISAEEFSEKYMKRS